MRSLRFYNKPVKDLALAKAKGHRIHWTAEDDARRPNRREKVCWYLERLKRKIKAFFVPTAPSCGPCLINPVNFTTAVGADNRHPHTTEEQAKENRRNS